MSKPFGTILTAMITPFDGSGDLDTTSASTVARYLTRPGWNDGLVVNGTTGESTTTTDAEKALLLEVVREAAPNTTLVAGVGSADTRHSIQLAREAHAAGADALLVVTPYYLRPSQEGILSHFLAIADAVDLPVMLYDIPKRSGVPIEHATVLRAANHPNILAIKDAKGDLEEASWVLRDTDLLLYSGEDALNLPYLSIGATGFVSVAGHVAAPDLRAMYSAFTSGHPKLAREIHQALLPIYRGLFRAPGAASVKAALSLLGMETGVPRLPLCEPTQDQVSQLREDVLAYRRLDA